MSYSIILKKADDTVHKVEVPKAELPETLTGIFRDGSDLILIEKTAASHAEDGMTNLQELIDDGVIKLVDPTISVVCEDWSCSGKDGGCHGGCPNWDPHDILLSEIPAELREFYRDGRRIG